MLAHTPLRYSAIDMSTFEALKLAYLRSTSKDEPGMLALLAFGSISGSVGATMVYPLNLVRTRLQASGSSGHPERYSGIGDVIRKTYRRDGWRGFYRGLVPTLAKVRSSPLELSVRSAPFLMSPAFHQVIPSVSISYMVYEQSKRKCVLSFKTRPVALLSIYLADWEYDQPKYIDIPYCCYLYSHLSDIRSSS